MAASFFARIQQKLCRCKRAPKKNINKDSELQLIFDDLLQRFCRSHHLPEKKFDADNCFQIKVDGYLPVMLHADVVNAYLSIYGPIPSRISGKISPAVIDIIKKNILTTNKIEIRNHGPDIFPQAPWIFGYRHLPIAGLHEKVLGEEIDNFVSWLRQYR